MSRVITDPLNQRPLRPDSRLGAMLKNIRANNAKFGYLQKFPRGAYPINARLNELTPGQSVLNTQLRDVYGILSERDRRVAMARMAEPGIFTLDGDSNDPDHPDRRVPYKAGINKFLEYTSKRVQDKLSLANEHLSSLREHLLKDLPSMRAAMDNMRGDQKAEALNVLNEIQYGNARLRNELLSNEELRRRMILLMRYKKDALQIEYVNIFGTTPPSSRSRTDLIIDILDHWSPSKAAALGPAHFLPFGSAASSSGAPPSP